MVKIIEITSLEAPELSVYTRLTEAQLRNRLEPEKGIFIAESPKVIKLALDCGYLPLSLLTERKHINGQAEGIIRQLEDISGNAVPEDIIPVYTADDGILESLTGYALYRGVLCAMRRPILKTAEEVARGASRIAVLENIADATNVGAIIRSAAALNMDAVLVTPSCCDPLCRRAVRVSMGTVFQIPWTYIGADREEWERSGAELLRGMGFKTAAMALDDNSVSMDDPQLAAEERLAIILGSEGDGLAKKTIADCDYTVKIPMSHGVDSLNVAAASAVAFWELRKRG